MPNKSRIKYNIFEYDAVCLADLPEVSKATHVRVYKEDHGDEWPWCVDAVDDSGNYTEELDRYATFEEALARSPYYYQTYVKEN